MLFTATVLFAVFMGIERILDASDENRIINPMIGFVLTLLYSSGLVRVCSVCSVQTRPVHMVHVFLYIACLLYVRAMLDAIFVIFFFPNP